MITSALLLYRNGKNGIEFLLAGLSQQSSEQHLSKVWVIPGFSQIVGESYLPELTDVTNEKRTFKWQKPFIKLTSLRNALFEEERKCVAIDTKYCSLIMGNNPGNPGKMVLADKNIVAGWFGLKEAYQAISAFHAPFLNELVGILSKKAFLAEIMVC